MGEGEELKSADYFQAVGVRPGSLGEGEVALPEVDVVPPGVGASGGNLSAGHTAGWDFPWVFVTQEEVLLPREGEAG